MAVSYGPGVAGQNNYLNVTSETVLKAAPGIVNAVSVVVSGSAVGGIYDAASTSGATSASQIGVIPNSVTSQPLQYNWRCVSGITVSPPTSGTIAVSIV